MNNHQLKVSYCKLIEKISNHVSQTLSSPYAYKLILYLHKNYKNKTTFKYL